MKLSHLLLKREALLWQAHLANLARAYWQLDRLVTRVAGARLTGKVCLQPVDPMEEHYWPVLTALETSQAVIEEHFTDEDILELAELLASDSDGANIEKIFRLENMALEFLAPLRSQLERAGVKIDVAEFQLDGPAGRPPLANPTQTGAGRPHESA